MRLILATVLCLLSFTVHGLEKASQHNIAIDIRISCPMSEEFQEFVKSTQQPGNYSSDFEEWKKSFVTSMNKLIELVESNKINSSFWTVNTDDANKSVKQNN